jgi:glutamyl-tRNA synthetase
MRLRFAPSPTGHLHVGNARTALFNWLLARGGGGTFVLRIEDTDAERSTLASERGIQDDVRWLGLTWDEGPDVGGPFGPYRQSERLDTYREYAGRLLKDGRAFYCFCTPELLESQRQADLAAGRVPRYAGTCRPLAGAPAQARLDAGETAAIRFAIPDFDDISFDDGVRGQVTFKREMIGDFVLIRSDGRPAYNFAVVVDDSLMQITHVIRGEDHVSNTPRQVLLYRAFGLTPPQFAHLSLVLGPDQTPLSKRHGATSVQEFRARGILPESLVNYLALIGWSPGNDEELLPIGELARRFKIDDVGKSAGVFDLEKLAWMNRHYIKEADASRLADLSVPYLRSAAFVRSGAGGGSGVSDTANSSSGGGSTGRTSGNEGSNGIPAAGREYLVSLMPIVKGAVDTLADVPARLQVVFAFESSLAAARDSDTLRSLAADDGAPAVIEALASELNDAPRIPDRETFRAIVDRVKKRTGQKGRALFHPIRVALTAQDAGPELDLVVPAIERGAELAADAGIAPITGCRERVAAVLAALAGA